MVALTVAMLVAAKVVLTGNVLAAMMVGYLVGLSAGQ